MEKHDLGFWIAAFGAAVVKLLTSEYGGLLKAIVTVMTAIFSAYFFTTPAMVILGLEPAVYTTAMAAVMALTGEGFMRWVMNVVTSLPSDPNKIVALIRQWRSGK